MQSLQVRSRPSLRGAHVCQRLCAACRQPGRGTKPPSSTEAGRRLRGWCWQQRSLHVPLIHQQRQRRLPSCPAPRHPLLPAGAGTKINLPVPQSQIQEWLKGKPIGAPWAGRGALRRAELPLPAVHPQVAAHRQWARSDAHSVVHRQCTGVMSTCGITLCAPVTHTGWCLFYDDNDQPLPQPLSGQALIAKQREVAHKAAEAKRAEGKAAAAATRPSAGVKGAEAARKGSRGAPKPGKQGKEERAQTTGASAATGPASIVAVEGGTPAVGAPKGAAMAGVGRGASSSAKEAEAEKGPPSQQPSSDGALSPASSSADAASSGTLSGADAAQESPVAVAPRNRPPHASQNAAAAAWANTRPGGIAGLPHTPTASRPGGRSPRPVAPPANAPSRRRRAHPALAAAASRHAAACHQRRGCADRAGRSRHRRRAALRDGGCC